MDYLQETSCVACDNAVSPQKQSGTHWNATLLSFLVLILPKCPLCVVAYTSSMAICGAPSIIDHQTGWGAWLAIGLALICLASIARNYRGTGTRVAIGIALSGIALVCTGLFLPNALACYYAGAALLLLSSFYNGRGYRWLNSLISSPQSTLNNL